MKELSAIDFTLIDAVGVVRDAYNTNDDFRKGVRASALSVLKEIKGSYSDEEIATMITDRIFDFKNH